MKITTIFLILLLSVATYAAGETKDKAALEIKIQEVEHQLVKSGLSEESAHATVQTMVQGRFTTEQMVQIGQQMAIADPLGISRRALGDKIREGVIKNVPPENIISAVVKVRNRYELAEKYVAEIDRPGNVVLARHYVDSLAAGLTERDANQLTVALQARIRQQSNKNRFRLSNETLITARDMVRQNISSGTTAGVICSALEHGYSEEDMQRVRRHFEKIDGNWENAALQTQSAIDRGLRAGDLEGLGGKNGIGGESSSGRGGTGASDGTGGNSGSSGGSGDNEGGSGSSGGSGSNGGSSGSGGSGGNGGSSGGRGK